VTWGSRGARQARASAENGPPPRCRKQSGANSPPKNPKPDFSVAFPVTLSRKAAKICRGRWLEFIFFVFFLSFFFFFFFWPVFAITAKSKKSAFGLRPRLEAARRGLAAPDSLAPYLPIGGQSRPAPENSSDCLGPSAFGGSPADFFAFPGQRPTCRPLVRIPC